MSSLAPQVIPTLRTADYAKSRAFYKDTLGFHIDWEHRFKPDFPVFAQIARDGMTLFLSEHKGDCPTGALIHFFVADVDAWYADLRERGARIDEPPAQSLQGVRDMTVIDPDGNKLRFFTRLPDWHRNPPSESILRKRQAGIVGVASRATVGGWLAGSVVIGHVTGSFRALPWLIGLLAMPALILTWQWLRARRKPALLDATGPVASGLHLLLFFGMLGLPRFVPSLWFTADAVLLFYGTSMLLAAARRQLGCEVLAIPNWLLSRNDQWGCLIFTPFDRLDDRLHIAHER